MLALRYLILFLILCNIPSYLLAYFGSTAGSISSYLSSLLIVVYFFLDIRRGKILLPFFLLGFTYFLFSGINYQDTDEIYLLKEFIRFSIVVIGLPPLLRKTSANELYYLFLIGGFSILINAFIFPTANIKFTENYGRFSGFYLNPNFAGIICIVGIALSYKIKSQWLRIGGQLLLTLAGLLTFSRTFLVIWILLNIFAIYRDRKNLTTPLFGFVALILIFTFSSKLTLNTSRFEALESIFSDGPTKTEALEEDSRTATWAIYYDRIAERPILGHGFMEFQKKYNGHPGVHNSYLMIIGESGFIPFLILVFLYLYILLRALKNFKSHPEYFFLIVVLMLAMSTGHQYFFNYYNVLLAMFLYIKLTEQEVTANDNDTQTQPLLS